MLKYVIIIAVAAILIFTGVLIYVRYRKYNGEEETPIYKIIFKTNCELTLEDIELEDKSEIPTLPTLSRNGYNFKGWYIDEECTKSLAKKAIIESDITLYAKWEEKTIDDFLQEINVDNIEKDIIKKVKKTYRKDK